MLCKEFYLSILSLSIQLNVLDAKPDYLAIMLLVRDTFLMDWDPIGPLVPVHSSFIISSPPPSWIGLHQLDAGELDVTVLINHYLRADLESTLCQIVAASPVQINHFHSVTTVSFQFELDASSVLNLVWIALIVVSRIHI